MSAGPSQHVVAVGVFDGLHRGHRRIIDTGLARAREAGVGLAVVTFDPHPDAVLGKSRAELPLTPGREKKQVLREWGVEQVVVLPFDREMAVLEPEVFVERHLLQGLGMVRLVTGQDFALGRGRRGNVPFLTALGERKGFAVESVPLLVEHHGPVSSTRVRGALRGGDVAFAAELLGRPYSLVGRVVRGHGLGTKLEFPTANLDLLEPKFLPADGVYAAWVRLPGDSAAGATGGPPGPGPDGAFRGALSLGLRPTFDGTDRALEVFLLDWNKDLRDRVLQANLVDWIRGQEKFDGPGPLVDAIRRDVEKVREILVPA
ncbi:MAG: bifunctional riboflavin kinase/FAD synthetase [Candidatus Eiseniibacteriota bacterium]